MKFSGVALIALAVVLAALCIWVLTYSALVGAIIGSWALLAAIAGGSLIYGASQRESARSQ